VKITPAGFVTIASTEKLPFVTGAVLKAPVLSKTTTVRMALGSNAFAAVGAADCGSNELAAARAADCGANAPRS
jgi:hypothetical protein